MNDFSKPLVHQANLARFLLTPFDKYRQRMFRLRRLKLKMLLKNKMDTTFNSSNKWFAVQTIATKEQYVLSALDSIFNADGPFMSILFPRRELLIRRRGQTFKKFYPLFPGYILAKFNIRHFDFSIAKSISGFIGLLGYEKHIQPLNARDVAKIQQLIDDKGVIRMSSAELADQHVTINNGPLKGYEGRILSVNRRKCRAKIELSLGHMTRIVDLGLECINHN